ncbi:DinB family protein [Pontibacter silvestris]|uniref:DinB family protein n=1 Tax=Pontibacter silvestris TaxID=2305183 RepID=A0ABW4WSL6_9BACT|nr:DinB family protein [Pontibacter silvestris]MCC9137710.1 DinB family protein [Pontibacter silvestris]
MKQDLQLREQLVKLMRGGQAFSPMEHILKGITVENAGKQTNQLPYTLWQLIEHLRIAQWDILEFSRNPEHKSPKWPDEYWPKETAPADKNALDKSIKAIYADLDAIVKLVENPANDLFEPFTHGDGQNLLREAMLVAEHTAYHLGQIVILRRLIGDWE